jgi:PAS domain S-box-containing protein
MTYSPDSLLKALYETLPDPVLVVDGERQIVAANAAAVSMFGYSEQELLKMQPRQLHDSRAESREIGEELFPLNPKLEKLHRQVHFRRKDGSVLPVQLTVSHIKTPDGEPVGLVAVIRDLTEVLAAQEQKQRAESLLKTAFASISEGFVVFDDSDRLVLCNDAYREIYALSAPAIQPGRTFESILRYGLEYGQYPDAGSTPEARQAWLDERLRNHARPGEPIIQRVGAERWVQVEESVIKDDYKVGLRTDVSALIRIKSEAERLGLILEGVAQEIYLINLFDGRIINANKSARENLQYSLEEIREMTPSDINVGHSVYEIAEMIAPMVSGEAKVLTMDTEHRRKDGTTYKCRVRLERMDDVAEPVAMAFAEDITERLEFERAIERKQHEFETLVRNLPDIITRSKPDTTLTYVNANYAAFTGLTPEEMLGRKFIEFTPDEIRAELVGHLECLTPEDPIRTIEQMMQHHTGERRWYLWSNLMVFENGEPVELVSVGRDVTESREARERIAEQSRELALRNDALEQFGGIVSHDLKAPLRQIRLFAEMIAEDIRTGKTDDLEDFSRHVVERARAMERMISSLFGYSQLAYRTIDRRRFAIAEACSEAWENLAVSVAETNAKLKNTSDLIVNADPSLLTQMLQNLFANSLKYRNESAAPVIRVSADLQDDHVVIAVEDNGIGIDPAHAESIFGVFQRLHRDERKYDGAGIGLALCRRIAESHGGTIALDPDFRDGARFVIRLPSAAT